MDNDGTTKAKKVKRETPWQLRGIPPEVRTAARVAARRDGEPIGKWVADAVMQKATKGTTLPSSQADNKALEAFADEMRERLKQLETGQSQTAPTTRRKVFRLFGLSVASFGDE